jgi:hypothetical protein
MRADTQKLSSQQKQIVLRAFRNWEGAHATDARHRVDLFYSEVLHDLYGLPTRDGVHPRQKPANRIFSPAAIGHARYHVIQSSVSRSILRLAQRGLVQQVHGPKSTWSGCILTSAGVTLARRLLIKPDQL